jgi:hypothetical protein
VVLDILASTECHTRTVQGTYGQLLGRAAESRGLDTFVGYLDGGGSAAQVEALVLASPEYAQRRGAWADATFVDAVYQDLLGRKGDPQGMGTFTAALSEGMPRQDVALAIMASPEAEQGLVAADYQRFLSRGAEAGGLSAWVGLLQQGAPADWVVAGILTSPEYGLLGGGGSGGSGSGGSSPATVPGGGHGTMSSGSSLCKAIQCPPPNYVYADQCGCAGQNLTRTASGAQSPGLKAGQLFAGSGGGGSGGSGAPVRYADGAVNLATCDLSAGGFGMGWGLTRSWTNAFMTSGFNGNGVVVAELPYLTQPSAGQVAPVLNAMDTPYYTSTGSGGNCPPSRNCCRFSGLMG